MDLLTELPEVASLRGVPVTLQSDVAPSAEGRADRSQVWRGVAVAEKALLAVAFLTDARGSRWVKSHPSWGNAVLFEVSAVRGGGQLSVSLAIGSYVWPPARAGTWDEIRQRSSGTSLPRGEIQVPRSCGWAMYLNGHARPAATTLDVPGQPVRAETGRPARLLTVAGEEPLTLDLLLLPRHRVRVGRLKIWHLRRRHRAAIPEPLRHVLSFGRTGRWPPRRTSNHRYV